HVAGADGGSSAGRVLVSELTGQHVADDLHVAMAVRAEAGARGDAVFVDHAQGPELDVFRVEIVSERERVVGPEPAVVGVASVGAVADVWGHGGESPW